MPIRDVLFVFQRRGVWRCARSGDGRRYGLCRQSWSTEGQALDWVRSIAARLNADGGSIWLYRADPEHPMPPDIEPEIFLPGGHRDA
jgi:hypothetical protein